MKVIRVFIFVFISLIFVSTLLFLAHFLYLKFDSKKIQPVAPKEKIERNKLKKIIGFLPFWSVAANVKVESGNFTDIYYFGLGIEQSGVIRQSGPEWEIFNSRYMKNLREEMKQSGTKFSVVIKDFDGDKMAKISSSSASLKQFISSLSLLIAQNDLDGINFDFEYPAGSNFPTSEQLSNVIEEVVFGIRKNNPGVVLSFDISGNIPEKERIYDVKKIGELMDFIILMGYDYKTPTSSFAGPPAPLLGEINEHTISESVAYLNSRVEVSKIVLGIPLYGYEWETHDATYKSSAVPKSGALATIKRVQKLILENKNILKHWDDKAKSPWFSYKDGGVVKEIYYEDTNSIKSKIEFAQENYLFGIAFWALGYEGQDSGILNLVRQIAF